MLLHITKLFSKGYGYILTMLSSVLTFTFEEEVAFAVVFLTVIGDLFWGIFASLKMHKFILSHALRETFSKIGIYAFALLGIAFIENLIHDGLLVGLKVSCAIAAACELWSMSASMLIIKPDMPFLKIFHLQLKGEIESKLGKNLDTILKDKSNDTE
jgi:hypothetical protein